MLILRLQSPKLLRNMTGYFKRHQDYFIFFQLQNSLQFKSTFALEKYLKMKSGVGFNVVNSLANFFKENIL